MDSVRRKAQGPALLAPGWTVRIVRFPMCVGGCTLTARLRRLIRPNPLVSPSAPHNPARKNGNTLSQEVRLVLLPLPPRSVSVLWGMLSNFAGGP